MSAIFIIPGRLAGLNELIAAERGNRYKGASLKKNEQKRAEIEIKRYHLKPIKNPVFIEYRFYEQNKRRDHDNVSGFAHKVIQDALVTCGILADDGWNEIKGYSDYFYIDKHNPRIEVVLKEV